jgi:4-(gamma-glutamylamino)butanal dehydrogenase
MTLTLESSAIRDTVTGLSFRTQAFVGGQFVAAQSGKTYESVNPANGKILARVSECDAGDVDRAVQVARKTADSGAWSRMSPAGRKKILLKFADLIDAHAAELAVTESLDVGKPIADCVNIDIPETAVAIRWHAEAADKLYDQVAPTGPENLALIVREPVGVVGAIIPWNYPAMLAAWKLGPALATGNCVVIKPAKQTSLSLLRIAELAAEAGLPEGVLNVVPGPGETVGEAIARHMGIDAVTFTGSTEIGRNVLRYSAESNLKRVMLELGGKSPQVVMGDVADLDHVAAHAANAVFWNMGENCSAGTRLIVQKNIKDALMEKLLAATKQWIVGDPLDPATRIGPMITKSHMELVLSYIEAGHKEGARLVVGGNRVLAETGGYFIEPTIFDHVSNNMKIAQEEIFGPVLAVIEFETEEQAVAVANDTPYGLAASLHTDNVNVAHRVARALKAGTVAVNCYGEGDMTTPFGGYKLSGFAGHDKSVHAHEQYTELKTIWMQFPSAR